MKQNWIIKKLGEVCEFTRGLTYSKNDEVVFSDNIVLRSNNIDLDSNSLDLSELKYIKSDIIIPNDKRIEKDSLIICTANGSKAHLGKVALINIEDNFAFGGFMGKIKPSESIYAKYLYYSMISPDYKKFISKLSDGANINNLKFKDLSLFPIPIPPLADQRRIVAILDDKFAKIDALKAAAQKNLDNAEQLWKAKLEKEFGNKEWKMMKLGEVAKIISGYAFKSKDFMQNGKYQVIRMGNIKQNQMRLNESPVYVNDVSKLVLDKSLLKINDLVITQTGTKGKRDYGFVARIYKDNLLLNQRCACVRFQNDNTYLPLFFLYFSYTNIYKNQFFANEGGTVGQGNVGLEALRLMNIPIPPLAEQTAIVSRLDALSAQISELKAKYRRQIECCDELRQSLLRAAFEGEM